MKNNIVKNLILIMIMSIFFIGVSFTEVNAQAYKVSRDTVIYIFNSEGDYQGRINNVAKDQEIDANEEVEDKETNDNPIHVQKVNSNKVKSTDGKEINKVSGDEWYIPRTAVKKVEGTQDSEEGALTSGEGTSVLIETNPGSGKGGGGLSDFTNKSTLDGYKSTGVNGADKLKNKSNVVVGVLQGVGTVVAVIMLTVIGIKYMISSLEERAEFKQTMMPYVIGAGSILIISNLVGLIYSIMQGMI